MAALLEEIGDALAVTALRSEQVLASYEAAHEFHLLALEEEEKKKKKKEEEGGSAEMNIEKKDEERKEEKEEDGEEDGEEQEKGGAGAGVRAHAPRYARHLSRARAAIEAAAAVVARREAAYRVPPARVAGWRWNPTAYDFGYLWTPSSLLYWWRDYGIASRSSPEARSPCYLNYQSAADIAVGGGALQDALEAIREHAHGNAPADLLTDCLASPKDALSSLEDL